MEKALESERQMEYNSWLAVWIELERPNLERKKRSRLRNGKERYGLSIYTA